MNVAHLEIFIDYYAAVDAALTRDIATTEFNAIRNWAGPALFDRMMTDRNAQEFCITMDGLSRLYDKGVSADSALAELVFKGAQSHYADATLQKFKDWVAPKEIAQVKRPSFGNVVMLHK